jgi:hypothetical protein
MWIEGGVYGDKEGRLNIWLARLRQGMEVGEGHVHVRKIL